MKDVEKRETGNVLEDGNEDNEMKAFGNFNLIRGMFRAIMGAAGGVTARAISINLAYFVLAIYPGLLAVYTLFFFRESSKNKWTAKLDHLVKGIVAFAKVIVKPFILLPALYMYVNMCFPPSLGGTFNFLAVKTGVLSIAVMSIIDNLASVIYYFVFLIVLNKMKGVALWKLFLIAGIANNLSYLMLAPFFFYENISPLVLGGIRFTWSLINFLAIDLLLMPMIGRISKYLPEGFESTGVVFIVAGLNACSSYQGKTGA